MKFWFTVGIFAVALILFLGMLWMQGTPVNY